MHIDGRRRLIGRQTPQPSAFDILAYYMQRQRADAEAGYDHAFDLFEIWGRADDAGLELGFGAHLSHGPQRIIHLVGHKAYRGVACEVGNADAFATEQRMSRSAEQAKIFPKQPPVFELRTAFHHKTNGK